MPVRLFNLFMIPILVMCAIAGCKKKPTYPNVPSIEFARLERYLVTSPYVSPGTLIDSIIITVNFKDGDGDLGMELNGPPYILDVVQYNGGNVIKYNGSPPYSCENYSTGQYDSDAILDTVLIVKDTHYYNYFIELLVKQNNGTYQPFVFPNCLTLDGRFQPLAPQNYIGPIEGSLSFTLNNTNGIQFALANETIRFRIYVEDHALNKSNTIETSDIALTY